jgi:hypothetical protein
MIIGSINIRGFGWVGIISFEITSNHLDFIIINPETRFGVMVESLCHFLWSNTFYYWSFVPFVGNNRGFCVFLLCIELSRGLFRVGCALRLCCFVMIVYSKHSLAING